MRRIPASSRKVCAAIAEQAQQEQAEQAKQHSKHSKHCHPTHTLLPPAPHTGTNTDHMYFLLEGKCRVLKRMDLTPTLHTKLVTTRGNGAGLLALEEAGCELPGNMTLSTMVESLDPRASMRNLPSRGQSRASSRGGAPSTPRGGLLSPRDEMARSFLSSIDESQLGTKPMLELGELNPLQYFGERALLDSKRTRGSTTNS